MFLLEEDERGLNIEGPLLWVNELVEERLVVRVVLSMVDVLLGEGVEDGELLVLILHLKRILLAIII